MTRDDKVSALRRAVERCGGLASAGDLARAWGLSRQRVNVLAGQAGFPEPVAQPGGRPVWARTEVDAWRSRQAEDNHATVGLSPDQLAHELGISAMYTRQWLRDHFPDDAPGQGHHWELEERHVRAVRAWRADR